MLFLIAGCADLERGPAAPAVDAGTSNDASGTTNSDSDGASLSFASNIRPLLETCTRCHVAGQEAGGTGLLFTNIASDDYTAVSRFVDTTTPTASRLLAKMRGEGHEGGLIYGIDAPEYMTVLQWIQQGAQP